MSGLAGRAIASLVGLFVAMAALLFGPPWTIDYWEAWVFLAAYFGGSTALTLHLLKSDPALLERRMKGGPFAEERLSQKIIMVFASAGFIALLVIPALDRRFGWSHMPLAVYFGGSTALTLHLLKTDPALLERRMKGGPFAEERLSQKIIMAFASTGFIGVLVVPALDRRFGWSHMPPAVTLAGDALVLLGGFSIHRVFRENSFTSARIELAADQRVISTGPYARVRHPMYAAALVMTAGIPIALGSGWGLLPLAAMMPALVCRILDEEKFLVRSLPGYEAYRRKVRYRLIPGVW